MMVLEAGSRRIGPGCGGSHCQDRREDQEQTATTLKTIAGREKLHAIPLKGSGN
jgi:hypothetical protein